MYELKRIAAKAVYRDSNASDAPAIAALEASGAASIGLTEAVLTASRESISIVAELDGEIVGHILLTPVEGPERALALASPAILPAWRDMQIGTEMVRHALRLARQKDWYSVFVHGQPDYYCRFGFKSRTADGAEIACQGPRFLALELKKGALAGWSGSLQYPDAFAELLTAHNPRQNSRT